MFGNFSIFGSRQIIRARPIGSTRRRRTLLRAAIVGLALVAIYAVLQFAFGGSTTLEELFTAPANAAQTAPQAKIAPAGPPPPAAPASTPFRAHAGQAGLHQCANLYQALGQALTPGANYAVSTQWDKNGPNAHTVQGVVGMTYDLQDYKAQGGGVVFASPIGQACEGNLVRVAPVQKPCPEVARTLPSGSRLSQNLSGTPLYDLGGNNAFQALLIPSTNMCIVVTVAHMAG